VQARDGGIFLLLLFRYPALAIPRVLPTLRPLFWADRDPRFGVAPEVDLSLKMPDSVKRRGSSAAVLDDQRSIADIEYAGRDRSVEPPTEWQTPVSSADMRHVRSPGKNQAPRSPRRVTSRIASAKVRWPL